MTKKIRVIEEGKQFEAFLKVAMTTEGSMGRKILIGVAYAGSLVACRAIHAALYTSTVIEIYDEETEKKKWFIQILLIKELKRSKVR